ncbi:MAG: hypothetical protein AAF542_16960 [Pseudomonadota bacterium]
MKTVNNIALFVFVLLSSTTAHAALSKQELLGSAYLMCAEAAIKRYGVEAGAVQMVENKGPEYKVSLRGVHLVLDLGGRNGERSCIVKKSGKVSFARNTNIR